MGEAEVVETRTSRVKLTGAMTNDPLQIQVQGVEKSFVNHDGDSIVALKGVDLSISEGEFVCFLGASGCGKSTLLNIIAGLLTPSAGAVLYGGQPVRGPNTQVGYLTQSDTLLPWRTVERNVELPLEVQGIPRGERRELVHRALTAVGLERFLRLYPAQLSGGMRRRALLARTVIYEPRTLLLDEPFGALDAQLRTSLQIDLLELCARLTTTTLFVTHDLDEALLLADRIIVFAPDPGRVVATIDNPLSRPRSILESRRSPEFSQLWEQLWQTLESVK